MIIKNFSSQFSISGRSVGDNAPVFFIAEAGVAHFGDMQLARQLFDLAVSAKADAFKLQIFDVDSLISNSMSEWKERLRTRNLTFEEVFTIRGWCKEIEMPFILTAHDESRIEWLEALDVSAVKIGSGERNNPSFLKRLAQLGKPIILSTGMCRLTDVEEALSACASGGCRNLGLLHCVSSYPTPDADINLRAMDLLSSVFSGPIGYSDHAADNLPVLSAVARGAKIIEKHITILRDVPNAQDWKVSAGPDNLATLIEDIRRIETILGHARKEPSSSEKEALRWALKSLVAARDLPKGHCLKAHDLTAKRPGTGLPPNRLDEVIGRVLARPIVADHQISFEDLIK